MALMADHRQSRPCVSHAGSEHREKLEIHMKGTEASSIYREAERTGHRAPCILCLGASSQFLISPLMSSQDAHPSLHDARCQLSDPL